MIHLELITHHLCTSGFYVMDDFMDFKPYQALANFVIKMHDQGLFQQAKVGLKIKAQHNSTIRTDKILWLDDYNQEPAVHAYLQQTKNIADVLNESLFLGLSEFESHFAVYPKGSFYKKHIDQFISEHYRKISCVYYLNNDWQEIFGGQLKLYNNEGELIQSVIPKGNRFVCFNSELPHEVCLTHQTRYSISGWMKTRRASGLPW